MSEQNDFISLPEAARLLRTTASALEVALESYGLSSFLRDSIGRDFLIRRGDVATLRPFLDEAQEDSSAGVA